MILRIVVCVYLRNYYIDCYILYLLRVNEIICVIGYVINFFGRLCIFIKIGNI